MPGPAFFANNIHWSTVMKWNQVFRKNRLACQSMSSGQSSTISGFHRLFSECYFFFSFLGNNDRLVNRVARIISSSSSLSCLIVSILSLLSTRLSSVSSSFLVSVIIHEFPMRFVTFICFFFCFVVTVQLMTFSIN